MKDGLGVTYKKHGDNKRLWQHYGKDLHRFF
jgi:hypothetical protein